MDGQNAHLLLHQPVDEAAVAAEDHVAEGALDDADGARSRRARPVDAADASSLVCLRRKVSEPEDQPGDGCLQRKGFCCKQFDCGGV